ncbi:MAG: vitamin K epoxide reductase family protein [Synechococcus sp. LacPavin_0920_WC12_MAG_50_7]|nr:vitamin K epoxide reductase family protein [Synechococcus sp. LacPavin_0920_WC12_MAG_50_7]
MTTTRQRPEPVLHRWVRPLMGALATVGAIDTASISLERWGVISKLSCPGGGGGCDKVLTSPWGTVAGLPLSLFGFFAYGALVLLCLLPLIPAVQQWLANRAAAASSGLGARRSGRNPDLFWQLGFFISLAMAIFSLVLIWLMLFKIQAICAFCFLSAGLSISLLIFHYLGRDWPDLGQLIFRSVIGLLLVGLASLSWAAAVDKPAILLEKGAPPVVVSVSNPAKEALAEFLNQSGAVMYTAYWCPHCHEQKELFGKDAAAKLNIVECAVDGKNSQAALCESKKIDGFPSWEINGKIDSGVKRLNQLADLSGFKGPRSF